MTTKVLESVRNDMLGDLRTAVGGSARYQFYTGSPPTNVSDAASGTLLADCVGNSTQFGTVASGVLTAGAVSGESYVARDDSANATGTVGYIRITTSAGVAQIQEEDIGTTGSGAAVEMPTLTITAGQPVEIASYFFRLPNG